MTVQPPQEGVGCRHRRGDILEGRERDEAALQHIGTDTIRVFHLIFVPSRPERGAVCRITGNSKWVLNG